MLFETLKISGLNLLIHDIKLLAGVHAPQKALRGAELAVLPSIENAYLLIEKEHIAAFGSMSDLPNDIKHYAQRINASGRIVMPAWVDSHTHIVFAGSREGEMVDKIRGLSYAEIAARGGGILNSASRLAAASEDELFHAAWSRLEEVSRMGTGSIEIKAWLVGAGSVGGAIVYTLAHTCGIHGELVKPFEARLETRDGTTAWSM